ncbi:hypothetical protein AAHA92_11342 [Salvia divinorum]|uniref:Uncharacterized protein n=1 Tax=Salvia divinorum TaxID=28513 RepID=A0ABD1HHJ9_SALDI
MDAKALAKSKRAHSLHHKKKHHSQQGLKASSPSAGSDDKKAAAKQAGKDLQNPMASSSQPTEFVTPKSKGADYAHMISEAQSHYSSDVVLLFDDFIDDFMQDFAPMLAAKGQSILSWIADDSFEFEDRASITPQLDEAHDEDKHDPQTAKPASSLSNDQAVTATIDLLQISEEGPNPTKKTTDQVLRPRARATNRSILPEPVSEHPTDSTSGKLSKFEAATAEAELDMLLNSFGDTSELIRRYCSSRGTKNPVAWRCYTI